MSIDEASSADNTSIYPESSIASSDAPSMTSVSMTSDAFSSDPITMGTHAMSSTETHQLESDGSVAGKKTRGQGLFGWLKGASGGKRKKVDVEDSSLSGSEEIQAKKGVKKSKIAGFGSVLGKSKSALADRAQRDRVEQGGFELDPALFKLWKENILDMDPEAEVDEKSSSWVRHSNCAKQYKVKQPYDRSRFRKHVSICLN